MDANIFTKIYIYIYIRELKMILKIGLTLRGEQKWENDEIVCSKLIVFIIWKW